MANKPSVTESEPATVEERVEAVPAPRAVMSDEEHRQSMVDFMKEKFAKEERVEVRLRNDGDVFLSVNGYSFLIKPNVKVKVPKSIVVLLEDGGYL